MSDDGTREVIENVESRKQKAENAASVRLIDNPGKIVSTGLNAAIRAARGEIIVRMDAHTEYAPDYVVQCVNTLLKTSADNVGGPARTRAVDYIQKAVACAYHTPFACGGARFHNETYEGWVDTVTYGCWRREAFDKFGYFDEELVRNQDDEHNLRITRGGGKIWQSPKIKSWYRPRGSLGALFRQYMQYGYWKVRVIQKHKLPASWRHLVSGAFVFTLLLLALCSLLFGVLLSSGQWSVVSGQWSVVSSLFPLSTFSFFALLALYSLAVLAASIATAAKTEWKLLPVLPAVFPCYHFGYGWGFLRGIIDFVLLRKAPNASFTKLTRSGGKATVPKSP
jgi:glycosyltransferase involved in cell wall biosynthesis